VSPKGRAHVEADHCILSWRFGYVNVDVARPESELNQMVASHPYSGHTGGMSNGATLHDVAALAGVSTRTVSRVVNDEAGFGEATRLRVLDAIEKVGYRPNMLARALITRRTGTIGLVVPQMVDPFFAELVGGVQDAAKASGRTMLIATHDNDLAEFDSILETLSSFAVDGAIVYSPKGERAMLVKHAERGLPIVAFGMEISGANLGSVLWDVGRGAELAIEHLVQVGCTKVAMLSHTDAVNTQLLPRRETAFRHSLQTAGLEFSDARVVRRDPTIDGGRDAMQAILASGIPVDGVFAYNDAMAIGALQALAVAGLRVPDDVALVGFNDIAMCAALVPSLTSVRLDRVAVGREAVALLDRIRSTPHDYQPVYVDVKVVVREST
jgi:LacI family transcriptional regulator